MGSFRRQTIRALNAVKNATSVRTTRLKGIIGSVLRRRINKSERQLRPDVLQYLEDRVEVSHNAHVQLDLRSNGLQASASSFSSDQSIPPSCWHSTRPWKCELAPWAIPDFAAHCMWLSNPRSLCTSWQALEGRIGDHARTNGHAYQRSPAIGYAHTRGTPTSGSFSPDVLSREAMPKQVVKAVVEEAAMAECSDKVVPAADDGLHKAERSLLVDRIPLADKLATESADEAAADLPTPAGTRAVTCRARPWNSAAAHSDWNTYCTYAEFIRATSQGLAPASSAAPTALDTPEPFEFAILDANNPFLSDWQDFKEYSDLSDGGSDLLDLA